MKWEKKGKIFECSKLYDWNQTHTQEPTVDVVDDMFRIYYSTRDTQNRSSTSYFDVLADDPSKIVYTHSDFVLPLGDRGCFDDCGVMPSCIVDCGNRKYLYYIGWNVRNTIPYQLSLGLAVKDFGTNEFSRYSKGPILDRSTVDPYLCTTAFVMFQDEKWHMWYASGTGFTVVNDRVEPLYHIKYASSNDGINWLREGKVAIGYKNDFECTARPSVIFENGLFRMWYTYRGIVDYRENRLNSYSIGYAESDNGIDWKRMDDKVGIKLSEQGWDSEMMAYPYVVNHKGTLYMFYNGNGFGQSGIGYAVLN